MPEIEPQKLSVRVADETVTALLYLAPKKSRAGITLILGHGAGGNQLSPFMRMFARGLAERGIDTITFNFVYSEKGRGGPDQKPKLEACYLAVMDAALAHPKLRENRLAIGGKSMGGRIGSQVAAALVTGDLSLDSAPSPGKSTKAKSKFEQNSQAFTALVFLGYPLHPPGKPEQLRDAHLKHINSPMLFIQGTRDPFAAPDELRSVIKRHKLNATLHLVDGGDHSLKIPRTSSVSQAEVYESTMDEIAYFLQH